MDMFTSGMYFFRLRSKKNGNRNSKRIKRIELICCVRNGSNYFGITTFGNRMTNMHCHCWERNNVMKKIVFRAIAERKRK